jgi:hypothetical protein
MTSYGSMVYESSKKLHSLLADKTQECGSFNTLSCAYYTSIIGIVLLMIVMKYSSSKKKRHSICSLSSLNKVITKSYTEFAKQKIFDHVVRTKMNTIDVNDCVEKRFDSFEKVTAFIDEFTNEYPSKKTRKSPRFN